MGLLNMVQGLRVRGVITAESTIVSAAMVTHAQHETNATVRDCASVKTSRTVHADSDKVSAATLAQVIDECDELEVHELLNSSLDYSLDLFV